MAEEDEVVEIPELPPSLIAADVITRFPLRYRLPLRTSGSLWDVSVLSQIRKVVLMNRQMATNAVLHDHDLKRYNMERTLVSVNEMPRSNAFLQSCRNLRSLILWRLTPQHLTHLPNIADVFAQLTTLELFECEDLFLQQPLQYVNFIGQLLAIPHYLTVFRYTAWTSYLNMGERVQTLLDNNPELQVLKIWERDYEHPWNLQFRTHLRSLHMRVVTTNQFWTSLTDMSRYWLTSFTSEVHAPLHQQIIEVIYKSLRTFRCQVTQQLGVAGEWRFTHQHLTTFALRAPAQNVVYENFLAIENTFNLTILDLSGVIFTLGDALRDLCHHCPLLQIFRFRSTATFVYGVRNALRTLKFLEELQILTGYQMIPRDLETNELLPDVMDTRVAEVVKACKRLRVIVCIGGAGVRTRDAMMERALATPNMWFFIDLNNQNLVNDYPHNLKWIGTYHWGTVFTGFHGEYFDWKILTEVEV